MNPEHILIVEDEPVVALDLRMTLEELGHEVCAIHMSCDAAIAYIEKHRPSMVLMDIHLQGERDGIDACEQIYKQWKLPVVFLTAFADDKTVSRAAASKPFGYVMKPFETKELSAVIQVARCRHDAEKAVAKSERRLAVAVEAADLAIWEWEAHVNALQGDLKFQQLLGSPLLPFTAGLAAMMDRVHPDDREQLAHHFEVDQLFTNEFRVQRDSGEYAWLEIYGKLYQNMEGQNIVVGALRDVTKRKITEQHLRQASVVFGATAEGILILDREGHIVSANHAFMRLTGYTEQEIVGHKPLDFLVSRRDNDPAPKDIEQLVQGCWSGEVACKCKDGRMFPAFQNICVVNDDSGFAGQFILTLADISSVREAERQLEHLAYHDPLTGLGNRYLLEQRLTAELDTAMQQRGHVAIIFIDLDGFKTINDSMGHHVGDRVIQETARRIMAEIRRSDEAIRLGGDEFVIIVSSNGQHGDELIVADKILKSLALPFTLDHQQFIIGASIGVASYPADGSSLSELLSAADSAMYEAKRCGKGRICTYSSDLIENVRTRLDLEQSMYGALQRNEFALYLQPIIDLHESKLIGFEALLRWNHPTQGLLSPDKFISIAEESGLIEMIGAWVLDHAVAQLSEWNKTYKTNLFVAVNVSVRQFMEDKFIQLIQKTLDRYSLPAAQLEIEITESMLQDFHKSRKTVTAMRDMGLSVAIDDFGTGYSSLALLKHLPVTRIKIDRSFIVPLPGSARDIGLVRAIVQMASSLGLQVTAEGIETLAQADTLYALDCHSVQGYYFGRPAPAASCVREWFPDFKQKN